MMINFTHTSLSVFKNSGGRRRAQRGSGLIEVMVSLLILAVGLLGMLSLQANGLNGNQRANFVTDAQLLAQDMADRILATTNTASAPDADAYIRAGNYGGIDIKKSDAVGAGNCNAGCTPAAAKTFNENEWLQAVRDSSLPNGRAMVVHAPASGAVSSLYTVQVMWDQDREGLATPACTINNCFQMEVRLP